MDTQVIYVDVLLNSVVMVPALIDSGCTAMAVISEQLVKMQRLETLAISPRGLEQVSGTAPSEINRVAWCRIDVDGFEDRILAYVVPGMTDQLIFGASWLRRNEGVIDAARRKVLLRRQGVKLSTRHIAVD